MKWVGAKIIVFTAVGLDKSIMPTTITRSAIATKKSETTSARMKKNDKRRLVIKKLAKERRVSLAVAAHIYACWPSLRQRREREKVVGNCLAIKTK